MHKQTKYYLGFGNLEKSGGNGLHPMQHIETTKNVQQNLRHFVIQFVSLNICRRRASKYSTNMMKEV